MRLESDYIVDFEIKNPESSRVLPSERTQGLPHDRPYKHHSAKIRNLLSMSFFVQPPALPSSLQQLTTVPLHRVVLLPDLVFQTARVATI